MLEEKVFDGSITFIKTKSMQCTSTSRICLEDYEIVQESVLNVSNT